MTTGSRRFLPGVTLILGLVLGGCASGPKYSEMKSSIPQLAPDAGRVFFYRTSMYGAAYSPEVRLNGTLVGSATSKGFFFVDRKPGSYKVAVGSQENAADFALNAGQTLYIRTSIAGFFPVIAGVATLIDESTARAEISDLSYTGDLPPPGPK